MICIYYQDEIGVCCKKEGFTWDKDFEPFRCDYENNMEKCPMGITIKQAEEMVEQIKFLQATIRTQADLLDKYQSSPTTTNTPKGGSGVSSQAGHTELVSADLTPGKDIRGSTPKAREE